MFPDDFEEERSQLALFPESSTGAFRPVSEALQPFFDAPLSFLEPTSFLASKIDLPSAVRLTRALTVLSSLPTAPPRYSREELIQHVEEIESELSARWIDAFVHAWKPRYHLLTLERAKKLLEDSGALEAAKGMAMKNACRTLWAPFAEFLDTQQKRARFELRDLKLRIQSSLECLSPEAARLVHLDLALCDAMRDREEELLRRVHSHCEQKFGERLKKTLRGVPKRAPNLEAAFGENGWIRKHFSACCKLIRATIHLEQKRLDALIEQCLAFPPNPQDDIAPPAPKEGMFADLN